MMFAAVPARTLPMVMTAVSVPASSRDTIVCRRITVAAAITTGSTDASGRDPWPPRPCRTIETVSAAAKAAPGAGKSDGNGARGRKGAAVPKADDPRRERRDMLPEHDRWPVEPVEQAV